MPIENRVDVNTQRSIDSLAEFIGPQFRVSISDRTLEDGSTQKRFRCDTSKMGKKAAREILPLVWNGLLVHLGSFR